MDTSNENALRACAEWWHDGYFRVPEYARQTEHDRWIAEQYDALADFQRATGAQALHCDARWPMAPGWYLTLLAPWDSDDEALRDELKELRARVAQISATIKERTGVSPRIKRERPRGMMLTVKQMAESLTLSSDVVYKMCEAREIPGVKRMPTGAKKKTVKS